MPYVVVTGTGTDIGKTYVTAAVLRALRARGVAVAARKPVQSYEPDSDEAVDVATDADVLAAASGETVATVCPPHRWLPIPLAPPMAASALGLEHFTIEELAVEVQATTPVDDHTLVFVEGAGGVRSPLAADGDTAALADRLGPALVVVVADANLGTINLVRLTVDALGAHPIVVFLNRYDPADDLHRRNLDWLARIDELDVATDVEDLTTRVSARARP